MDGIDIGLFDFDRHNALYYFIINADEQIYMRYGGRDAESATSYLNLRSLELALEEGLEMHARREVPQVEPSQPLYPTDIPLLKNRTALRGECVECHLIADYQNIHKELDGSLDRLRDMYRSPDIKTIGIYLIVRARHEAGWNTYAMDNELRAAAALTGKKSLGIEQGIDIKVERGLELDDRWRQTEPQDFSQPVIRWFTYGFDETALFACRVKEVTSDQVILRIRGQACNDEECCQLNVALKLQAMNQPVDEPARSGADQFQSMLKGLVPVEKQNKEATP